MGLGSLWLKQTDFSICLLRRKKKMAGIIDSNAHFKSRLVNLKMGDLVQKFTDNGWTSMAELAFAANFVPGKGDETVLVEKVFKKSF